MKSFILDRQTSPNDPKLVQVPNESFPIYNEETEAEADSDNLEVGTIVGTFTDDIDADAIFDIVYPIGITYVQYPQQKSPNELWEDTTWEEVNYEGAFFRASGGKANGFATCSDTLSCCKQGFSTAPNGLKGSLCGCTCEGLMGYAFHCWDMTIEAPWKRCTQSNYSATFGDVGVTNVLGINITPTGTVTLTGGDDETRPDNYTIKVWRRIS